MAKSAILLLCGLGLIQIGLVRAQVAQTAWAAPTSGGAMGFMPPMRDFTDQQNHMAIMNINTARTEAEAAQAATAVFHPTLDTADIVKTALEDKIRQLRAANNPAWMPGMPLPRLPSHFDANDVIMASYYQNMAPAAPPQRPGPPFGAPQPGPRTNIRRGVSPQRRQGNFRQRNRGFRQNGGGWSNPSAWPANDRGWNTGAAASNPIPAPSDTPPAFTPLASTYQDWIGLNFNPAPAPAQQGNQLWF